MTSSASLVDLPDEILLTIALVIDTFDDPNATLCNLALTNRRFTAIAREALVRNAIVPRQGMSDYVTLLQKHPECTQNVEQLEVYGYGTCPQVIPAQLCYPFTLSKMFALDNAEQAQSLRRSLTRLSDHYGCYLWPLALYAFLPNLKSLVVKDDNLPWIFESPLTLDSRDLALQRVRATLLSRTQELSVFHDREIICLVRLEEMPNLKVLNISQTQCTRR